jgi:hypothetical protein
MNVNEYGGAAAEAVFERRVMEQAIKTWGDQAQIMMVYEEMSELQKELCKNWRGRENIEQIAEEVADVEIMLAQLKMIYGIAEDVARYRTSKIERLAQRLKEANHES